MTKPISLWTLLMILGGTSCSCPLLVESFSPIRFLGNLFKPSSTHHLAELLEAYDIFQDPTFLEYSSEWRDAFGKMMDGVEVTAEGVVEGQGLVATRDFEPGELVALYPIHALGYSNGRSPPRIHERSERQYPRPESSTHDSRIVGTSDLLYFEDESRVFGDDQEDFSYSMTDPSGKYCFDVNPKRHRKSERNATYRENHLFVAHYVNDASFADFSPIVTSAKELQKRQQARDDSADFAKEAEILDAEADRCAVRYLETSILDPDDSFNVVMCGFGPPPLMAYIAMRPVARGEEFLASYGLGYWLGKAFADETNAAFDASEYALTTRIAGTCKAAEDRIQAAWTSGIGPSGTSTTPKHD